MAFFLISIMVLGLLDHLQTFSQLYLIELLGFLTGPRILDLQHLIHPRLLTGFGMLQALAYEKQGLATIAHLVTKFRGYRHVKSRTPSTKKACGGVQ